MLRHSLLKKIIFMQLAAFVTAPVMSNLIFESSSTAYAQSPKSKAAVVKKKKNRRRLVRKKGNKILKKMRSRSASLRASLKKFAGGWWIETLASLVLLFLASWFLRLRRTERLDTLPAKRGFRVPSYFPRSTKKVKEESLHVWTDH